VTILAGAYETVSDKPAGDLLADWIVGAVKR
jgi:hypothetical protein